MTEPTGEAKHSAPSAAPFNGRRVLILVENLPVPFDRRVWQEATTLARAGYQVCVVCPMGRGHDEAHVCIDGIHIYRYRLAVEAQGAGAYFIEYPLALWHTFRLSWRVWRKHGLDAIHACNPPDLLFLVGAAFKVLARSRFLFDHHDVNPELYEAKFGRRDLLWRALVVLERLTFRLADVSLATNESYRAVAIERGGMDPSRVFVVRSGPILAHWPLQAPKAELRCGRRHLVGYSGVMGKQEGIDLLLLAVRHIVRELGRQDIHFGLVGGGTAWADMRRLCTEMGLDAYVTFTGRVPQQELLDMLNTADVCVNPDVANPMNDISTMNKIMEYMALAKPIVQFDLKEGRFSAQDASLYAARNDPVDLARKIVELIDDPQRRARMGAAGRARVEAVLDWRHEAPQLLRAYETLFAD